MAHTPQRILKDIGTLSASLLIAFVLFMGIMIVRGAFTEPAQAPPNANTAPPFTTSNEQQSASEKRIVVKDLWAYDLLRADGSGLGAWLSSYSSGRKRYQAMAITKGTGVALDTNAMNELCKDDDGCRMTLSFHDYDDYNAIPANARPGMVQSRGPFMFFISTQNSGWWKTSPQGGDPALAHIGTYSRGTAPLGNDECLDRLPGPAEQGCVLDSPYLTESGKSYLNNTVVPYPPVDLYALFFGTEGKDNNGIIERVVREFDCYVTDGEYPATPGDTQAQFSLYMQAGGTYATQPTRCLLDVED